MVVMLSPSEEYSGGAVELRRSDAAGARADERYELRRGDALAWKGWASHRVSPVRDGAREVFVRTRILDFPRRVELDLPPANEHKNQQFSRRLNWRGQAGTKCVDCQCNSDRCSSGGQVPTVQRRLPLAVTTPRLGFATR